MIQTNLTKDQKTAWIEALKSGKYIQCQDGYMSLENKNNEMTYCCMGVLNLETGENADEYVPVQKLLDDINTNLVGKLYTMNDCHKKSFLEIADYIEENLAVKAEN